MTSTAEHGRWATVRSDAETLTGGDIPSPSKFTIPGHYGAELPPDFPMYLPVKTEGRSLVLCFDGTGDQFDSDNSNIVELTSMLKKDEPDRQLVYYQAGIGTYTIPQVATPGLAKVRRAIDGAIARSLDAHIMGGYEFIMQNYRTHDKICIFGFSRGAYTARCLAGMLHKVGLLPASNHQQVPFAYKMYTRADELGWCQSNAFKRAFSIDVRIHFLGVWETVSSVGIIPRHLPFTTSNTVVRTFRQALALDERRARFQPNVWNKPTEEEEFLSVSDQIVQLFKHKMAEVMSEDEVATVAEQIEAEGSKRTKDTEGGGGEGAQNKKKRKDGGGLTLRRLEIQYGGRAENTDVEEVWFAGAHCDVGGGSVTNGSKPCLARIPLRWMIRECFKTNSGIIFSTIGIARTGIHPQAIWPQVLERPPPLPIDTSNPLTCTLQPMLRPQPVTLDAFNITPEEQDFGFLLRESEEEHDRKDALGPIYDQLSLNWHWWLLELVPMRHKYQRYNGQWTSWFGPNLGNGRHIPHMKHEGVKVHSSVRTRMEAEAGKDGKKYWPKSNLELQYVKWVN